MHGAKFCGLAFGHGGAIPTKSTPPGAPPFVSCGTKLPPLAVQSEASFRPRHHWMWACPLFAAAFMSCRVTWLDTKTGSGEVESKSSVSCTNTLLEKISF